MVLEWQTKIKLETKTIHTKEAEKIILKFNKSMTNSNNLKNTDSSNKNKAKSNKISKK